MEPEARNGAKSGETTQLLRGSAHSETRNGAKSGETVHLLRGNASSAAPVIRRGSATSRVVKNGGSRQESRLLTLKSIRGSLLSTFLRHLSFYRPLLYLN